jgi:outer membrane protein OmpA-like peptidoglycan-associated protein
MLAGRDDRTMIPVPSGATTVVTPRTGDTADLASRIAVLEARLASNDGSVATPARETPAVATPPAAPRPPAPEIMDRLAAIEDSLAALASDRSARDAAGTQRAARDRLDALLPAGVTRVFPEIVFSSESAGLDAAAVARVNDIAAALAAVPDAMVRVVGHTDDRGAASFNQRVSESRAATVADLMFARGVARAQVITEGRGESEPLADNGTAEGRRVNRRVEFTRTR